MLKFKNVNTGVVLTGEELKELHLREYNEMWENKIGLADEFETKEEFITYMKENDIDGDFEEIN